MKKAEEDRKREYIFRNYEKNNDLFTHGVNITYATGMFHLLIDIGNSESIKQTSKTYRIGFYPSNLDAFAILIRNDLYDC